MKYGDTVWPRLVNPADDSADMCADHAPTDSCLQWGDPRVEDNAHLASITLLFWYEHNRIANDFALRYPQCPDEVIFQETRRILIALFQKFIYNDWAPIALGSRLLKKFGLVPGPLGTYFDGSDVSFVDCSSKI